MQEEESAPICAPGRPRVITAERVRAIAVLRAEGLTWPKIGLQLGLKPETCRRAVWASRRAGTAVENPPAAAKNPPPEA
jgi:hypothetical protein